MAICASPGDRRSFLTLCQTSPSPSNINSKEDIAKESATPHAMTYPSFIKNVIRIDSQRISCTKPLYYLASCRFLHSHTISTLLNCNLTDFWAERWNQAGPSKVFKVKSLRSFDFGPGAGGEFPHTAPRRRPSPCLRGGRWGG